MPLELTFFKLFGGGVVKILKKFKNIFFFFKKKKKKKPLNDQPEHFDVYSGLPVYEYRLV